MPDFVDIPINATAEELEAVARMGTAPEDGKAYGRKNGEWVEVINTVEQDYNPDSANAQSGKAVAEAVSTKADANNVYTKTQTVDLVTAKTGNVNPTVLTVADFIGQHYINTANGKVFECIDINHETSEYFWLPISNPTVDRVYNSTSTNAQSGIAVSEAVSPKADKTYVDEQLGGKADKENTYTKSETQEYVSSATANFITATANNLINYYLKSEIYTKNEVQNLIGQIQTAHFEVVQELPQTGESNVIYLILRSDPETSNIYDEYIYINNAYEKIGSTDVDLTGYATETWVNTQIANFLTQSQIESLITTALANYDTSAQVDAKLANKVDKFDILESIDYVIENGEAIILGRKSTVSADKFIGHITLPSTITDNGVTYPVTGLGRTTSVSGANFLNCTEITGVDIPATVTYIGHSFFRNTGLINIYIPYSVTKIWDSCFNGCNKLQEVNIANPACQIREFAFKGTAISSVKCFKKTVDMLIEQQTYNDCRQLKRVFIEKGNVNIGASAFAWNGYFASGGYFSQSITDVYFEYTEAEFNALTTAQKESLTTSNFASGVTYHYGYNSASFDYEIALATEQYVQNYHDSTKQNVTDNALNTVNKNIVPAINEVNSVAKGANQAVSFVSYSDMVTTVNALAADVYRAGQNVMIQTLEVPDLWVYSVESTSVPYTYTTDEAFINGLDTDGYVQVGYYKLSALETQKVDLTDYYDKTETDDLLENKLTEPSSNLAVGKYFRVASIDENGHAVLECVDPPTAPIQSISAAGTALTPDANGNVEIPFPNASRGAPGLLSLVTGDEGFTLKAGRYLKLNSPLNYLQQRLGQFAVLGNNYDTCVKWAMTDGVGAAWTDAERLAALLRMGCTVDENGYVKWTAQS